MITVHKGNAETTASLRLILTCDQCHVHVSTDVPFHNIRDLGIAATEAYLERARDELGQTCPHIQEERDRQEASQQEARNAPQRRSSSYIGAP